MKDITLHVVGKTFSDKRTSVKNPNFIPRKGDKVDMGYEPCCTVIEVIWKAFPNFNECWVVVD